MRFLRSIIKSLLDSLSRRHKKDFILLALVIFGNSVFELFSIGSIIPFLSAITAPDRLFKNPTIAPLIKLFSISKPDELILPLTIIFCLSVAMSCAFRMLLTFQSTRLSFNIGGDFSSRIFENSLHQPYNVHVSKNSSEIISCLTIKINIVISQVINPLLTIISNIFSLVIITLLLFCVDVRITVAAILLFGIIYLIMGLLVKNQLRKNAKKISFESKKIIKIINEGLGGIRDVLIDQAQDIYCADFKMADFALRNTQGNTQLISILPKYFIEGVSLIAIASFAYILAKRDVNELIYTIPTFGLIALSSQRILPAFQQLYGSWTSLKGSLNTFWDVIELLSENNKKCIINLPIKNRINITKLLELENIFFRYDNNEKYVIKNLTLKVRRGEKIAIVGDSGAGKSTLVDLISGLLVPTSGIIKVDGLRIDNTNLHLWQKNISHVPQNIYLTDKSVAENIAFGVQIENIDFERVALCAKNVHISQVIESWENGYNSLVGERGARLSGGQLQRIGIARALYKNTDVIILDEITSALDEKTESQVMDFIDSIKGDKTLIIITHRVKGINKFDAIYKLRNGNLFQL